MVVNVKIEKVKKGAKRGKKTRKLGRNKRKPAKLRYTSERRWITNKRRKAQGHANRTGAPVRIKVNGEWEVIRPLVTE